jgi:hypothetical protein
VLRIDVEAELRQLDRDVAVETKPLYLARDKSVMRGRLVGSRRIGDVFTEARQHGANAKPPELRRGGERVR